MSDDKKQSTLAINDLPDGWIQQYDPTTEHPFWVDTKATPPRAIWIHPYQDEQFLDEHPELRSKESGLGPPVYSPPRRHSFSGSTDHVRDDPRDVVSRPDMARTTSSKQKNVFAQLRDRVVGTREERDQETLAKRRLEEQRRQYEEERRQQEELRYQQGQDLRQSRGAQPYYDDLAASSSTSRSIGGPSRYASPMAPAAYGPTMYGPPAGDPYAYGRLGGFGGRGFGGWGFGGRRFGGRRFGGEGFGGRGFGGRGFGYDDYYGRYRGGGGFAEGFLMAELL
ncbi:hypothetical protein EUX98_g5882 [Antrodiella citrinella]|uniref:WW domain-containing protein n=1 Tax=Antrodiella citrinella TaxID=2447956 RepID=A0A4S4MS96_9APHY|nr:hypothetical protein EUX98_g5882 [Antrodiella citrinella]